MVSLKRRVIDGKSYYYLEHSVRKGSNVGKKELYLGLTIPKNIGEVKRNFMAEIYKNKWNKILETIKKNFSRDIRSMPKSIKEKQLGIFMVKFTYDSQRIEGSRLTLRDTANLLEKGITPSEKPLNDVKEAEAHKEVFYEMVRHKKDISFFTVLHWHKKLFINTKSDIAGRIRTHGVAIAGSKFTPPFPVELYPLLDEFFKWYNRNKKLINPVELAAFVHLKFVTIHPFGDGNGRISRLMMNFILNKCNYPMFDIPYENRNSYYTALERSQIKNNELIFVQWFIRKYIKENKKYLN